MCHTFAHAEGDGVWESQVFPRGETGSEGREEWECVALATVAGTDKQSVKCVTRVHLLPAPYAAPWNEAAGI